MLHHVFPTTQRWTLETAVGCHLGYGLLDACLHSSHSPGIPGVAYHGYFPEATLCCDHLTGEASTLMGFQLLSTSC